MGYSLLHDEAVLDGIRRVGCEQCDEANERLGIDFVDDPHGAIHDMRKRCKKIRGAVRLVRPAVRSKQYRRVNTLARDAARELSGFRDARALVGTFERLRDAVELDRDQLSAAHELLLADRASAERELRPDHPALEHSRSLLDDLRDAIDELAWNDEYRDVKRSDGSEWQALASGLVKTYERGRAAMAASIDTPSGESFHEWRKRAKYTRYHLSLLTPSAPDLLEPLEDAFHHLTDALGDAHDLYVLEQRLGDADQHGTHGTDGARLLVAGARTDLERRAVHLGRRLYAESGGRFQERLGSYWQTWRSEPVDTGVPGETAVGGIDRVVG